MLKKSIIALSLGAFVLSAAPHAADAKTLKVQASSKAGDWAHRFMKRCAQSPALELA